MCVPLFFSSFIFYMVLCLSFNSVKTLFNKNYVCKQECWALILRDLFLVQLNVAGVFVDVLLVRYLKFYPSFWHFSRPASSPMLPHADTHSRIEHFASR